jgi:hypothetical protein
MMSRHRSAAERGDALLGTVQSCVRPCRHEQPQEYNVSEVVGVTPAAAEQSDEQYIRGWAAAGM